MDTTSRMLTEYFDRGFLNFLETVPDALVLSDRAGCIVLVNTNAKNLFGYSGDELLGEKVEILVPPRLRAHHRRHRAAYYADPSIRLVGIGRDQSGYRKDGTEIPIEISLSPVKIRGNLFVWSAIRSVSEREHSINELRAALNEVKVLTGLISICAWCKRIRDERGTWQPLESYIQSRSETKFTHGLCEDCLEKLNPCASSPSTPRDSRPGGTRLLTNGSMNS
jgi:PAS domain S-box-containing protein